MPLFRKKKEACEIKSSEQKIVEHFETGQLATRLELAVQDLESLIDRLELIAEESREDDDA